MPASYFSDKTLESIGYKKKTDKSSIVHDYLKVYDFFMSKFRNDKFTFMELGVGFEPNKGASLKMWKEYFSLATIVGVDVRKDCKAIEEDRIRIEIGDCSDPSYLANIQTEYNPSIIVDDASHKWSHQIVAFETLFPRLPSGGIYVCEDIHTSFEPLASSKHKFKDGSIDAYSYFSNLCYLVVSKGCELNTSAIRISSPFQQNIFKSISSMVFLKHSVLLTK